jgi:hypothetical protein
MMADKDEKVATKGIIGHIFLSAEQKEQQR